MDEINGQSPNADGINSNADRKQYNMGVIELFEHEKHFVLELNVSGQRYRKKLVIERSGRIYDSEKIKVAENVSPYKFSAFLGVQNILDQSFLVFVERVSYVTSLDGSDIFEIAQDQDKQGYQQAALAFIPFISQQQDALDTSKQSELAKSIINIKRLFSFGHYFSYQYDLTLSKQKQASRRTFDKSELKSDLRFSWNRVMAQTLLQTGTDRVWIVHVIQGYVGGFSNYVSGKKVDFFLISRRSSKRGGTRYNHRGVDDDGNPANFVESEQIIFFQNYCVSQVQIRGSVPIFWQQRGLRAEVKLSREYELTNKIFLKHFDDLKKDYQRVLIINLLAVSRPEEKMITTRFEEHIQKNTLPFVKYEYFDFHHQCKNENFDNVNPLIFKLHQMNENFRFYVEEVSTREVLMTQKGVIRTNCLDCLDRTNVVQTKLALDILAMQLLKMGINLEQTFGQLPIEYFGRKDDVLPFMTFFRNQWATNGDYISIHYTGTNSTHTDVVRNGQRDISGKFRQGSASIERFYHQNVLDSEKQLAIDLVSGDHIDTQTQLTFYKEIDVTLKQRQAEYTDSEDLTVYLLTWNVHQYENPQQIESTSQLFDFRGNESPDIVVIALQELYSTNVLSRLWGSSSRAQIPDQWAKTLGTALLEHDSYQLLKIKDLEGMLTLVYVKDTKKDAITRLSYDTSAFTNAGSTRGAIAIKFNLNRTSFCFLNVHMKDLSNGSAESFDALHRDLFQAEAAGKLREERVEACDYKFVLGTLAVSLTMMARDIQENILMQDKYPNSEDALTLFKKLLESDEMSLFVKTSAYAKKYFEAPIDFRPTYRYRPYSTEYDFESKASWPDRILSWKSQDGNEVEQLFYARVEMNQSSHKPICAFYKLKTQTVNKERQDAIIKEIFKNMAAENKNYEQFAETQESETEVVAARGKGDL